MSDSVQTRYRVTDKKLLKEQGGFLVWHSLPFHPERELSTKGELST